MGVSSSQKEDKYEHYIRACIAFYRIENILLPDDLLQDITEGNEVVFWKYSQVRQENTLLRHSKRSMNIREENRKISVWKSRKRGIISLLFTRKRCGKFRKYIDLFYN